MKSKKHILFLIVGCMITGCFYIINSPRRFSLIVALLIVASVTASAFIWRKGKKFQSLLFLTFFLSFLIKADYIIYTPTWVRQHDVIGFGAGFGQAGFIEYFYENFRLLSVDPRDFWGFFQPPLHHMTAALWLKVQVLLGYSYPHACENIQVLTLFYSCMVTWFAYFIFKELSFEKRELVAATALVAFHPSFILMSGSINNDMLCILFQIMSIYFFLRFSKEKKWKDVIFLAVCVGCSMMSKLSGVLIAPALGISFLYSLIKNKKDRIKEFCKLMVFGIISIPLGIWSPVRNLIKFNLPLNYTPEVGEPVGMHSLLARCFDFRTKTPFSNMIGNGNAFDEFNVMLTMLKTSLFGEYNYGDKLSIVVIPAWILLIIGAVFMAFLFYITWQETFRKDSSLSIQNRIFFFVYYCTSLLFFLNLSFSIPNFSSMDFRYIAYIIVVEAIYYAVFLKSPHYKEGIKRVSLVLLSVFCVISVCIYFLLGTVSWQ